MWNPNPGWMVTTHLRTIREERLGQAHRKPHPQHSGPQPAGNSSPKVLPEEWRVPTPHWVSQLLRHTLERQAPKTSNFGNQWGSCPNKTRLAIWEPSPKDLVCSDPPAQGQAQMQPMLPDFKWRRLICWRSSAGQRGRCPTHRVPLSLPELVLGMQIISVLPLYCAPSSSNSEEAALIYIWCPDFCSCCRGNVLDLAL